MPSPLVNDLATKLFWQVVPGVPPAIAQWFGAPFGGYAAASVREVLTGTRRVRPAVFATVQQLWGDPRAPRVASSAVCAVRLNRDLPPVEVLVLPASPQDRTAQLPAADPGYGPLRGRVEVRALDPSAVLAVLPPQVQTYVAGCEPGWYFRTTGSDVLSWWPVQEQPSPTVPQPPPLPVPVPPIGSPSVQWRLDRLCDLAELMGA